MLVPVACVCSLYLWLYVSVEICSFAICQNGCISKCKCADESLYEGTSVSVSLFPLSIVCVVNEYISAVPQYCLSRWFYHVHSFDWKETLNGVIFFCKDAV